MLEGNSTKEERHDSCSTKFTGLAGLEAGGGSEVERTRHMTAVREQVRCVCNEKDEAAFNAGEAPHVRMLEQERSCNSHKHTNHQADGEYNEEDANSLEQTGNCSFTGAVELPRRFKHDNSNGIVEDAFAKNDGVELRIYLVGVEYSKDRDRVGGREGSSHTDGLHKGDVERLKGRQ